MTIEEALRSKLAATAAIASLVGGRIYVKTLPQGPAYPAIVYHRISGPREHSHAGSSSLAHPRFQVDCLAPTYAAAKAVAEQVRLALDGFTGSMAGGVQVDACLIEDDRDDYDDDFKVYIFSTDYVIWHQET